MGSPQPGADRQLGRAAADRSWLRSRHHLVDRAMVDAWRDKADQRHAETRVGLDSGVVRPQPLAPGISVIVPSYRGRDHIDRCLRSLGEQTLDPDLFELIVVLNGRPDGRRDVLEQFRKAHESVRLRIIELTTAGASRARNAGIAAASRVYTTFVDDDDYVSPAFLEVLLAKSRPGVVPFASIVEVGPDGEDPTNHVNRMLLDHAGKVTAPVDIRVATTVNAGKAIQTALIKDIPYDIALASGEDIVFWMTVVARRHVAFYPCPPALGATYYRVVREESISRPAMTFDFAVRQHLDTIARLERLAGEADVKTLELLDSGIRGQTAFINKYLLEHPEDHGRVAELLDRYPIFRLPYERMNDGLGRCLAIAFAFPPFADTSAVVAAKRIRARGDVVDVVYNAMDTIRERDGSLRRISGPFVDREAPLRTPSYFSHFGSMERFAVEGLQVIKRWETAKGPYERIYSRAQFAASHFLAAAYKLANPATTWTAEFSDPLSRDVRDQERHAPVTRTRFTRTLRSGFRKLGLPFPNSRNAFVWCEELAYSLADELVFTNENQMNYMLNYSSSKGLAELARGKAVIIPHPTLPSDFYSMIESGYRLDPDRVHLAYFGRFYETRGLDDVLAALVSIERTNRGRVSLHVFTPDHVNFENQVAVMGLADCVDSQPYVPYIEFLNLTTRFDCLVVTDANTGNRVTENPYLPSKWADYLGSGTPIWGVVERNSALSRHLLDFASPVGDAAAARQVLLSILHSDRRAVSAKRVR